MKIHTAYGCVEGSSDAIISIKGSLFYLLKHHPKSKPVRNKKLGLVWLEGKDIFQFDVPDLLTQEVMAVRQRRFLARIKRAEKKKPTTKKGQ